MQHILITGIAGFIGFHLERALKANFSVSGIDTLNTNISKIRAHQINRFFYKDIHSNFIDEIAQRPDIIIHLAAETGIPDSLKDPSLYFKQNVAGTFNVLEQCRKNEVKYLIYASSSSVYEPNEIMPETAPHSKQLSFYGTSKCMTEVMVENYCQQFGITAIGLRFFTVYGSWTRPDMAAYKFMKAIHNNETVTIYNEGNIYRDFTHVSDIATSIKLLCQKITGEPIGSHKILNIGFGQSVSVKRYAELIAQNLGKTLYFKSAILPLNELKSTCSDNTALQDYVDYRPKMTLENGVTEMVTWFKSNSIILNP